MAKLKISRQAQQPAQMRDAALCLAFGVVDSQAIADEHGRELQVDDMQTLIGHFGRPAVAHALMALRLYRANKAAFEAAEEATNARR